ncbi:uncharacterized protein G2W53_043145 [Senna tora]|uniref:Uncharacterized protein n=1 Tax=Senna tora TaxID=362788 RepID=A0A834W4M7_9FABA|nr:uncharacterized protein G2W53_043145 [Senna tora]
MAEEKVRMREMKMVEEPKRQKELNEKETEIEW